MRSADFAKRLNDGDPDATGLILTVNGIIVSDVKEDLPS
jgi:hypothetical protein